jgi:hypothetical protein
MQVLESQLAFAAGCANRAAGRAVLSRTMLPGLGIGAGVFGKPCLCGHCATARGEREKSRFLAWARNDNFLSENCLKKGKSNGEKQRANAMGKRNGGKQRRKAAANGAVLQFCKR